jgi:thiamine-phosphate pyrophosphorylase
MAAATSALQPATTGRLRGLYAITPDEADSVVLEAKVRAALAGGARIVQYRNKFTDKPLRHAQALALRALCRAAGAAFIINDDLALALAIDADGVHLGRDDGDIAAARQALGPVRLLGASCYDRLDLAQRALELGADHIAFGSVFSSPTKPGAVRASLTLFGRARRQWDAPLIAIGGITADNAREVVAAGADAIAVISALFDAPHIEARARQFATLFNSQTPPS